MNQSMIVLLLVGAFVGIAQAAIIASNPARDLECLAEVKQYLTNVDLQLFKSADPTDGGASELRENCKRLSVVLKELKEAHPCFEQIYFGYDQKVSDAYKADRKLNTVVAAEIFCSAFNLN